MADSRELLLRIEVKGKSPTCVTIWSLSGLTLEIILCVGGKPEVRKHRSVEDQALDVPSLFTWVVKELKYLGITTLAE
jgi:hypothetical protein